MLTSTDIQIQLVCFGPKHKYFLSCPSGFQVEIHCAIEMGGIICMHFEIKLWTTAVGIRKEYINQREPKSSKNVGEMTAMVEGGG